MNTFRPDHTLCKAKARHWCFLLLILCFHLAMGNVPGPCRHSVTKEHLGNFSKLKSNQMQNGCSITYSFTQRQSLSPICYIKAAFPQILELLRTHFTYQSGSDNKRYVQAIEHLVNNIYSQKCIPDIDESVEDHPVKFVKTYRGPPTEALQRAEDVIKLYMDLMTQSSTTVNWNCAQEYADDLPESTSGVFQTTGPTPCHCSCTHLGHGSSEHVSFLATNPWNSITASSLPKLVQQLNPFGCLYPIQTEASNSREPTEVTDEFLDESSSTESTFLGFAITDSIPKLSETSPGTDVYAQSSVTLPYPTFIADETSSQVKDSAVPFESTSSIALTELFELGSNLDYENPSFVSSKSDSSSLNPKSSSRTVSIIKQSMGHESTATPLHDNQISVTPDRLKENSAILLVKRSVDPRLNILPVDPSAVEENALIQDIPVDLAIHEPPTQGAKGMKSSLHSSSGFITGLSSKPQTYITTAVPQRELVFKIADEAVLRREHRFGRPPNNSSNKSLWDESSGHGGKDWRPYVTLTVPFLACLAVFIFWCRRRRSQRLSSNPGAFEDERLNELSTTLEMPCCEIQEQCATGPGQPALFETTTNSFVSPSIIRADVTPSVPLLQFGRDCIIQQDSDPKQTNKSTAEWTENNQFALMAQLKSRPQPDRNAVETS